METITYLTQISEALEDLEKIDLARRVAEKLIDAERIYVIGNGGSSAMASHFAQDLRKVHRKSAHCVSDNVPHLTAVANDKDFEYIFADWLGAEMLTESDVLVGHLVGLVESDPPHRPRS